MEPSLTISNYNSPRQTVVSGPTPAIHALKTRCDRERIRSVLTAAFGLPATMADDYAGRLCPDEDGSPFVKKLGKLLNARRDRDGAGE